MAVYDGCVCNLQSIAQSISIHMLFSENTGCAADSTRVLFIRKSNCNDSIGGKTQFMFTGIGSVTPSEERNVSVSVCLYFFLSPPPSFSTLHLFFSLPDVFTVFYFYVFICLWHHSTRQVLSAGSENNPQENMLWGKKHTKQYNNCGAWREDGKSRANI